MKIIYLSQFVSEMPDSLQRDSTKCTPQYEFTSFVPMAIYWVPDLPDTKSFPGRLWRCILIFVNGPSSARSSKLINMLGQVCGLLKYLLNLKSSKIMKSDLGDWKRVSCHGNPIFIAVGVLLVELLPHQVSVVST